MTWFKRHITIALGTTALALSLAGEARAGEYAVHACRYPDGANIGGADGWSYKTNDTQYVPHFAGQDCAQGFGIFAPAGRTFRKDSYATAQFIPPAGTGIVGVDVWPVAKTTSQLTSKLANPGDGTDWQLNAPLSKWSHGANGPALSSYDEDVAFRWQTNVPRGVFGLWMECFEGATGACQAPSPQADGLAGYMALTRSRIVVRDTVPPEVSRLSGSLTEPGPRRGPIAWRYDARDVGGGVYREIVVLDGKTISEAVVDPNGGRCASTSLGHGMGVRDFVYAQPCRPSVARSGAFDTHTLGLADGEHQVSITIEDAGGERTNVWTGGLQVGDPKAVTPPAGPSGPGGPNTSAPGAPQLLTLSPGQANGVGATRRARLVVGFARRGEDRLRTGVGAAVGVKGRLLDERGRGIGEAQLEVSQVVRGAVDGEQVVRTAKDGSFAFALAKRRSSRRISVGYRAFGGDEQLTAQKELSLTVVGSTSIKADKRATRNGGKVRISGTLLGRPVPEDGVVVAVQGRAVGGRWVTFATARAGASGRWSRTYQFRATFRRTRYQFRAKVMRDSGYAFEPGTSKPVSVVVRP